MPTQKVMMDKLSGCIFLNKDNDYSEKYNTIKDKLRADIKKEFDSESVYNKMFLKTKIKSYGDEVTDFLMNKFLRWTLIFA